VETGIKKIKWTPES